METIMLVATPLVIVFCVNKIFKDHKQYKKRSRFY
jgi:hypothetical protein